MATKVGVRHRNGSTNHYEVNNVESAEQAREYVLANVPTARTVMALVIGGDRRGADNGKVAA